jgi:hypothetical protein
VSAAGSKPAEGTPASATQARARAYERVARALLSPQSSSPLVISLAGSADPSQIDAVAEGLRTAARAGGIGMCTTSQRTEHETLPLLDDAVDEAAARVVLVCGGAIDERRLHALQPPGAVGADVLVWVATATQSLSLRSLYLLGLWTWAQRPARVRCLLLGEPAHRAHATAEIGIAMRAAGVETGVEVLAVRSAAEAAVPGGVLAQILRGTLAAARRSTVPRPAAGAQVSAGR